MYQGVLISAGNMTARDSASDYPLGATDAEHERLIRQAQWVNPHTERCFREAGIGPGYRVLDLGSGVGDVALLLAKLVGPTGEVVGVERDPRTIARARNRIAAAGLHNVSFTECDASQVSDGANFDAAVGRHVLLFLPDPVAVLRSLSELVRPGGVLAFQEMDWGLFMTHAHSFPLWSAAASLIDETCRQSGTNFYLAPKLLELFREAGIPAPSIRTDILVGAEEWMPDVLQSIRPQVKRFNLSTESLGDLDTLSRRLRAEVAAAKGHTPLPSVVSAWSRKSATPACR